MGIWAEGLNFTLQFIDHDNGGGTDFLIDDTTNFEELTPNLHIIVGILF